MFTYLLKVTICWLGFYLTYAGFLKKETFFKTNRWYLLATLLLGAGIPLVEFLPIFQEAHPVVVYFQPLNDGVYYVQYSVNEVVTSSGFGWSELFLVGYILGVGITSIRFFVGLGKIYNLYRSAEIFPKKNHILVLTNPSHLPFSFFKYLFWSKDMELNDADGEKIITHEEAHVKGWHSVDVILVEIFSIIFWCSPMVYFYKKSLKTVHEYLADAVVLQTMPTKKYGHLLLRQSQSGLQIALANHFFHSQLKQRIIMMTRSKSRKEAIIKYLFAIPVILLLLIAFSKKEAMANLDVTPSATIQLDNTIEMKTDFLDKKLEKTTKNDVDEMPRFPGCEEVTDKDERQKCSQDKMLQFIYTKIKYPKTARESAIEGRVEVEFVVKKDGSITNLKVLRGLERSCDEEVLRVVNLMPKWIPATKDGQAVDVKFTIPVSFKLQGEEESEPIYKLVEEMPRFSGCEEMTDATERKKCAQTKMLTFIYTNIRYPKVARDLSIQGRVIVKFVIKKDGSIAEPEVLRGLGGGCDEEVLRIINLMPKWVAGKQGGKAVNVNYILPVMFKLAADSPSGVSKKEDLSPIFVVDGKITNAQDVEVVTADMIQSVEMLKGKKAINKYGQAAKNGAILITTKKEISTKENLVERANTQKEAGLTFVKISPNPTSGLIDIEYKSKSQKKEILITITDLNGKEIFRKKVAGGENTLRNISVKNAAKGILFIAFQQGEKLYSEKIILQ